MPDNELPDDIRADIDAARAQRERAERETRALVRRRDREYVPMWERIGLRRIENSIGEEYLLSLELRSQ